MGLRVPPNIPAATEIHSPLGVLIAAPRVHLGLCCFRPAVALSEPGSVNPFPSRAQSSRPCPHGGRVPQGAAGMLACDSPSESAALDG